MGYIGPVLVRRLRASYPAATLIGVDAGYFAHCLTPADAFPERMVDVQCFRDVRNVSADILDGIDAVVHLAAISNDPMGNRFTTVTKSINHHATTMLARMAKEAGVGTFVFASSCSMYGAASDEKRTEQSQLNPLTAYAVSKVTAERDLEALASPKFLVTSLRLATACGMSNRLRLDLVLNDFVAAAVAERKINILSDGTPWRPLITVHDIAIAIDWAISRNMTKGGAYLAVNTGSDAWNYQVRDLAEAVAQAIPGVEISVNKKAIPDKRSYHVNFDLYRQLAPKHQPEMDLHTTVLQLKDGLESMHFGDRDFRNSRLIRLVELSRLREAGHLNQDLQWRNSVLGRIGGNG